MEKETIIKRADGTRIKILAQISTRHIGEIQWSVEVYVSAPGKRTWHVHPETINNFEFRRVPVGLRNKWEKERQLEVVTAEEILLAKLQLWESIKPQI